MALLPTSYAAGASGHLTHSAQIAKKLNKVIDAVEDYSCVGDGVTNDAANLISAISAAVTNNAELFLPAGTYFTGTTPLTTPTTSGGKLRIRGAGKGVTTITRTAASATSSLVISLTGAAVVELSDFTIAGPTGLALDNGSYGVQFHTGTLTTKKFRAERIEITGTHDHAIGLSSGGKNEVIDCDLTASDVCCATFESSDTANSSTFYARGGVWQNSDPNAGGADGVGLYVHPHISYLVHGVTFKNIARYGIYQNGSPGSARQYANAVACSFIECDLAQTKGTGPSNFTGCTVRGSVGAESSLGGDVNISGCYFEDTKLSKGTTATSYVAISGSTFKNAQIAAGGTAGFRMQIRDSTVIVTNAAAFSGHAIQCGQGLTDINDVTFDDDSTSLTYQTMIGITGASATVRVRNSDFRACRGTLGAIYMDQATAVLTLDGNRFDGSGSNVNLASTVAANSVDGFNNVFTNSAAVTGSDADTQKLAGARMGETYTVTNVTTDRAYDANATTLDELADVLGTLIAALRVRGIVQ